MTVFKERIIGAITVMNDSDAKKLWEIILKEFSDKSAWDNIEEDEPTEEELEILNAYKDGDEEYQPYVTHEELKKEFDL